MNRSREDWISKRAYALWEAGGRPAGRDFEHWVQASNEFDRLERTQASADGSELLFKLVSSTSRLLRASNIDRPQAATEQTRQAF
jgi:hypothetical protein